MRYPVRSMPLPHYKKEERPWGSFERFTKNEPCTVKILQVGAHKRFSLQRHSGRSEFWHIVAGDGRVQVGEVERAVKHGDEVMIELGMLHRITGGENGISVLEISFGEFREEDIVRVEDDFGRA